MIKNSIIDVQKIKNANLAYWVGVAQTDGYFKKQFVKSTSRTRFYVVLGVGKKSLPMLNKFKQISNEVFMVKGNTFLSLSYNKYHKIEYKFGCNRLIPFFNQLNILFSEPLTPPTWIVPSKRLFGAYLAGVIDGDGDIRITRPKYPQCYIRITSKLKSSELLKVLSEFLSCSVKCNYHQKLNIFEGRQFIGKTYITEFRVSKKNFEFFKKFVYPHIVILHKKEKLRNFMKIKGRKPEFEVPQ
ncbi:MAG: hypothetical protein V1859_06970 [archaeon]